METARRRKGEKKNSIGCTPFLLMSSLKIAFERQKNCLMGEIYFGCKVTYSTKIQLLLVFSVTPFKIDQNKNQNRSIDKVQKPGNGRR